MGTSYDLDVNEQSLLNSIKEGDEKAFEYLFKSYYPHLVLFAQKYLNDRDLSESLVQDVFVNMWMKREDMSIRSLKGFLVVAVRNKCNNELKHQKVVREFEKSNETTPIEELPHYNDEIYLNKINEVIDQLPAQRKRIFRMSRMDGLKYREIADKLNISPKTVEVQMGKSLKFLREKLQPLKRQLLGLFL
ncbi:RNA polymerase sigma-70 factor [Carboxylicivirga linearis]|uniref:RNA polymerase sigma-70 factor n=1 Tax=Carboxylicivirga linearis TaxID=1628157 RepID=A0ABS5JSX7_9BACT|nr:RNA polymerase sigma-70 factor [Carboxylicivirga linearis]MBS2097980.1 RNA polymerase sigma-70 factor [Carboxylicivirga linearis]